VTVVVNPVSNSAINCSPDILTVFVILVKDVLVLVVKCGLLTNVKVNKNKVVQMGEKMLPQERISEKY